MVLLLALFGASGASDVPTKTGGICPLSRLQAAFQMPFSSLSSALHRSSASSLISQRPEGGTTGQGDAGVSTPQWITERTVSSSSRRTVRSRRVDVLPMSMSAVETKQAGSKRAAVGEPDTKEDKAAKKARRITASAKTLGVHVIGLSHHHAGVDIREKLAVPEADWNQASAEVRMCICSSTALFSMELHNLASGVLFLPSARLTRLKSTTCTIYINSDTVIDSSPILYYSVLLISLL